MIFILTISFLGCDQPKDIPVAKQPSSTNKNTQEASETPTNVSLPDDAELQQQKSDLLNGVFRAICYSGFRSGQHPDRGDGAKNPSYDQTLEDLKILSRDSNFSLIRIYDSGENSNTVLKVIKENDIDIKVMLGIWLNAELSAHETCAWLTEPIPGETLAQNKDGKLTHGQASSFGSF